MDRRSRRAWYRRGASWRWPWLLLASWRLVLWRSRDDGHDVDSVAGEDGDVRVVLEEAGGGGDVGGFDDKKASDLVLRIGSAGFGDAPGLAHHDIGRDDGGGVALAPLLPRFQADLVRHLLLGFGVRAEGGEVFRLHGVDGDEARHGRAPDLVERIIGRRHHRRDAILAAPRSLVQVYRNWVLTLHSKFQLLKSAAGW